MFSSGSTHAARDARGRPSVCVVVNITVKDLVQSAKCYGVCYVVFWC